ncbi:MAG: hypothetical protein IPP72_13460 [Chitinophagaceae bacterium]|nr:hypothetical protein [Chitinophagaceae bacterium]
MGNYKLPLDRINKIEVIEKDKKRTTNSYVGGGIGITLGIGAIAFIIMAAAVSSMTFLPLGP